MELKVTQPKAPETDSPKPVRYPLKKYNFHRPLESIEKTVEVYTEWANHYLEKANHTEFIRDIRADLSDGVLLANIIHSVVHQRVQISSQTPTTTEQNLSNISACLEFLHELGVDVQHITAKGIADGELRHILTLFFNLSKYKHNLNLNLRPVENLSVVNGEEIDRKLQKITVQTTRACANRYVSTPQVYATVNGQTAPKDTGMRFGYAYAGSGTPTAPVLRFHRAQAGSSDSTSSPSVSTVSPASPTTTNGLVDTAPKTLHSRLNAGRFQSSSSAVCSTNPSITNRSTTTNSTGTVNGVLYRPRESSGRTNIPVNQKTAEVNIAPSESGIHQPKTSVRLNDYGSDGQIPRTVQSSTSAKLHNGNALSSRNGKPGRESAVTPNISQNTTTRSNVAPTSSVTSRAPGGPRSHSGVPRRHFTRRLAPSASAYGAGTSTVSDGELEKARVELPPELPSLSVDRIALTPPSSVFDRFPRPNPPRSHSSVPMPRVRPAPTQAQPKHGNVPFPEDSKMSHANALSTPYAQTQHLTGHVMSTVQNPGAVLRVQAPGMDHTRMEVATAHGSRNGTPVAWPIGNHTVQHPTHSDAGLHDTYAQSYGSSSVLRPIVRNNPSCTRESFRSASTNNTGHVNPGSAVYVHGGSETYMGTFPTSAHLTYPSLSTFTSSSDSTGTHYGSQILAPRSVPRTACYQPQVGHSSIGRTQTATTVCSLSQPHSNGNQNTGSVIPEPSPQPTQLPTNMHSSQAAISVPAPFVPPAVHRPANQLQPIPPARRQSLLRTYTSSQASSASVSGHSTDSTTSHLVQPIGGLLDGNKPSCGFGVKSNAIITSSSSSSSNTSREKESPVAIVSPNIVHSLVTTTSERVPGGGSGGGGTIPTKSTGTGKVNNVQAEQRQRARELYAAVKHRHPSTDTDSASSNTGGGGSSSSSNSKVPVSLDGHEMKCTRKSQSTKKCSPRTSSKSGLCSPPTATRDCNHASVVSPESQTLPQHSGTMANDARENTTVSIAGADMRTSEQLAKMLKAGNPQARSYLQAYARREGQPGPITQSDCIEVNKPTDSVDSDQATLLHTCTEPFTCTTRPTENSRIVESPRIGSSPDSRRLPGTDRTTSGSYADIIRQMGGERSSEPLCNSLSSSVSVSSTTPVRSAETAVSSLPRHVRLSGVSPADGPFASPRADNEPPDSPDLNSYAKRMQERMKEGLRAAQESLWVSTQSRTASLSTPPRTSHTTELGAERACPSITNDSSTSTAYSQAIGALERLQTERWDHTSAPLDRLGFDLNPLATLLGHAQGLTGTQANASLLDKANRCFPTSIQYPTLPSWTPTYSRDCGRTSESETRREVGSQPVTTSSREDERSKTELKNGTYSDVEDLIDQAKRRTLPLLGVPDVSMRRDGKLGFNSASDTEDPCTTVGRIHRSAGMHFGYTLPGPKPSWPDVQSLMRFQNRYTNLAGTEEHLSQTQNTNSGASWSRVVVGRGESDIKTGRSVDLKDDIERIYGIVPWSLTAARRCRPLHTTASPEPGVPDGTASAPPGTPIKLPYGPPSTMFAAAMVRPEFAHLFDEGSNLSLTSNNSHASTTEEKQAEEIQRLRKKLELSQQQVAVLTSQLVANAHVVSAFEQSLNNMSQRLQNLTHTTAKKDSELHDLRATIDSLRSQSGLGLSKLWSKTQASDSNTLKADSAQMGLSREQPQSATAPSSSLSERPTSVNSSPQKSALNNHKESEFGQKKNGWFRSSIGKAFRKKSSASPAASTTELSSPVPFTDPSGEPSSPLVPDGGAILTPVMTDADTSVLRVRNSNQRVRVTGSAPLNGLSPSNSSTSSSSSWGASVSASSETAALSSSIRTAKSNEWKLPPLSGSAGLDSAPQAEDLSNGTLTQGNGSDADEGVAKSPTNHGSIKSDELLPGLDSSTATDTVQLQAQLARLRDQLNERELQLTDVQLEALASTHQVNQLRDQISRLYAELQHLRTDNERLYLMVKHEAPKESLAPLLVSEQSTAAGPAESVDRTPCSSSGDLQTPTNNKYQSDPLSEHRSPEVDAGTC